MSVAALTWAFAQDVKPALVKFILVALADNADDAGQAFPSIAAIVAKTSEDRKTVQAGLIELERRGLIRDTGDRVGRTGQVKVFELIGMRDAMRLKGPASGTVSKNHAPSAHAHGARADISGNSPVVGTLPISRLRGAHANDPESGTVGEGHNDPAHGIDAAGGTVPSATSNDPVFPTKDPVGDTQRSRPRDTEPSGTVRRNHQEPSPRASEGEGDSRGTDHPSDRSRSAFLRAQSSYPAGLFAGSDWLDAEREFGRRVDEGVPPADLVAAAAAYTLQQQARGTEPRYVLSPARFFSRLGKWRGPFPMPAPRSAPRAKSAAELEAEEAQRAHAIG